jgi:cystathionine beta-lyase
MTIREAVIRPVQCSRSILALLENGARGFAFASGMAAISTVAKLLQTGDEILADSDLYGGTCRLFSKVLDRTGITARYVDACDVEHFEQRITPNTACLSRVSNKPIAPRD